ncbi:hypothetical protein H4R24_003483 [Coemansia sp. RSA 988]|nr:hypothetical protein H4R24_003483 [Coemansia sp. RSA 988]
MVFSGGDNQVGIGGSNTVGIGGGTLPTALVGGGFGLEIDSNNIIMRNLETVSEGGYLNAFIATFQGGIVVDNQLGYQSSDGVNFGL